MKATDEQIMALVRACLSLNAELKIVELKDGEELTSYPAFARALHAIPEAQEINNAKLAEFRRRMDQSFGGGDASGQS